jgi:hypothetical protein
LLTFAMFLFGFGMSNVGGPLSGIGGILVFAGAIVFAINIWKNVKKARAN